MKHSQWLRLKVEGDKIVMALRTEGYQCRKQTHRLSWNLRKGAISYNLTWLPTPVSEWSLLPNDATPEREMLLSEIRSVLDIHRGCGRSQFSPSSLSENNCSGLLQVSHSLGTQGDRFWLQENYPWMIVRLLPNAQRYVVARFYSRSEADNHKRFLSRFMPAAEFEVVFDAPPAVAPTKLPS
ncbi:MAG TPA: hypothetical protein DCE56_26460 [Cyanobacteria bacterium UBA8553]|nr:hypothetical protein [Cyanobacteria bacterium UBA8553]HAJ61173.1 hypothetical protein [Cyanobacteria bacterium UBA8543]